jgi:hypothetical protein
VGAENFFRQERGLGHFRAAFPAICGDEVIRAATRVSLAQIPQKSADCLLVMILVLIAAALLASTLAPGMKGSLCSFGHVCN